jgi:membrane-bound ClpP family serine protease
MHRTSRLRRWRRALPVLAIMLLAGHGVILYQVSSRALAAGIVVSGAAVLLVLAHLGVFGSLYAMLRRRAGGVVEEAGESDSDR